MFLQTEYEFTLPRGYVDESGRACRHGVMRLATAIDEIEAKRDPKAAANPEYVSVTLLARVIVKLENVEQVTPAVIEKLFTADFKYLQDMYETINGIEDPKIHVQCPHCGKSFTDTLNFTMGE